MDFKILQVREGFHDCWGDPLCGEYYIVTVDVGGKKYNLRVAPGYIEPDYESRDIIKDLDEDTRAKLYAVVYEHLFPNKPKYHEVSTTGFEEALADAVATARQPQPEPRVLEFKALIQDVTPKFCKPKCPTTTHNVRVIVPGVESAEVVSRGNKYCQRVVVAEDPFSFLHREEKEWVCRITPSETRIVNTRPVGPSDADLDVVTEPDVDKNLIIRFLGKKHTIRVDPKLFIKFLNIVKEMSQEVNV